MSQIIAICPTCKNSQFKKTDDTYGGLLSGLLFQCLSCEDIVTGDNLIFTFIYYDEGSYISSKI